MQTKSKHVSVSVASSTGPKMIGKQKGAKRVTESKPLNDLPSPRQIALIV